MDSLPEKLQELAQNKYFTAIAVVVFAFITALVFALIAFQSQGPSVDSIRQEILDENNAPGRSSIQNDTRSPVSKIIDAITGRKPVTTDNSDSNSSGNGNNGRGGTNTVPIASEGADILKKIEEESIPLPKVEVGTYVLKTRLPESPQSAKIHTLKTDYTESDVRGMAADLGLLPFEDQNVVVDKGATLYQIYDLQNDLFLAFDMDNGSYIFISDNGVTPTVPSSDPRDVAESFMTEAGLYQDCLRTTAAYESSSEPGTTIVEMRCGWDYLGAPFVNTIGVLNLPENTPLSSVRLGDTSVETSFAGEEEEDFGQRGADDFNTVFIKVKNNAIVHIGSNIPQIARTDTIGSGQIIPPTNAVASLNAGNTNITLSSPSGAGYIELPKVYPNGVAQVAEADVNDFMLAYTTIPGFDQTHLCPVWVSRSSGLMSSGYNGLFVSTMKAVNDSRCTAPVVPGGSVAGVSDTTAVNSAPQKLIAQNTAPSNIFATPTGPAPTVKTGDAGSIKLDDLVFEFVDVPALGCPEASTFTNGQVLDESKGIYMMWKAARSRKWYLVFTDQSGVNQTLESTSGKISQTARREYLRKRVDYVRNCKPRTSQSVCPRPEIASGGKSFADSIVSCVLLTTGSPSIYVHTDSARNVQIDVNPHAGVGFADPVFSNISDRFARWNVFAQPAHDTSNSTLAFADGTSRHRAYYEFRRLALLEQLDSYENENGAIETGYVVSKAELSSLVSEVSAEIGLNEAEVRDWQAEIARDTRAINSEYVRVAMLPTDFVETNLPVEISPQPEAMHRYILYIEAAAGNELVKEPQLSPIVETGYTVVETGLLVR